MELSRISSLLAIFGALNIFYGLYVLTRMEWASTFVCTVTFLALMYSATIVDSKSGEMARDREIELIRLQASKMGKEVHAY